MCGFVGFFDGNVETERNVLDIQAMLDIQKHRGPDDQGAAVIDFAGSVITDWLPNREMPEIAQGNNLWFGFNRLSIQDLTSAGHQPMIDRQRGVVLMMNGEIYNAQALRAELIQNKAYKFKSTSDTEVALALYSLYGIDNMLEKLNGMFSFAIADVRKKRLFLIRDRYGIKPLYYTKDTKGNIAFTSEIKSLKAKNNIPFELNRELLDEFLLFRHVNNETIFKGMTNVTPGTYLEIKPNNDIVEKKYYSVIDEGLNFETVPSAETLEITLSSVVKSQMISDVKLGCQLSGGVDSSLVSKFAAEALAAGNLETVSIIFDDPRFSEKQYIDTVSKQLSLKSHQYLIDSRKYIEKLNKSTYHFEQPLNHPNTIGIYLLSEEAKKEVTVLLSGEGADEAFCGYSRFLRAQQNPFISRSFLGELKKHRYSPLDLIKWYGSETDRMIMATAFSSISDIRNIYPEFNFESAMAQRRGLFNSMKSNDPNRQRKYEMLTYLPDLLMRQDKMSMAHTIENRVPFLDHDLVKTAFQFNNESLIQKRNNTLEGKFPIKEIAANIFGEEFAFRNKMGFGIPLKQFFNADDFKQEFYDSILPGIKTRGIFDAQLIEKNMNNLDSLKANEVNSLWLMQGFERWANLYL